MATGQRDTFTLPTTLIPAGSTINWLKVHAWCGLSQTGSGFYKIVIYTHSTLYNGIEYSPPDTYWHFITEQWTNNPYTGSPWTIAELNALEIGVALLSTAVGPYTYGTWCTQIYTEVDYDPPVSSPGGRINKFNRRSTGGLHRL